MYWRMVVVRSWSLAACGLLAAGIAQPESLMRSLVLSRVGATAG